MHGQESSFNLKPLSDEQIDLLGLSLSDVWMIQFGPDQVLGPFSTQMLQEDSQKNPELYEKCIVYNLVIEEWKNFYKEHEFQRRQPKLVPAQNLIKNESFLVLENGQKTGPFSFDELEEAVEAKKVSLNQEVSVDEGLTWIKIYEHHAFDRRLRNTPDELPFPPTQDLFAQADQRIAAKAARLQNKREDHCAISGLAFIGRGNDKGQTLPSQEVKIPENQSVSPPELNEQPGKIQNFLEKVKWKYVTGAVFALLVIVGGFNAINGQFHQEAPALGETKKSDVKRINNGDRSVTPSASPKRKPASVQKSRARVQSSRPARHEARSPIQNSRQKRARKPIRNKATRISHSYEDFENLDIEDPRVREELARELAGDYYDDERADQAQMNGQGQYIDDYPEEPAPREGEPAPREEEPYPRDDLRREYDDPEYNDRSNEQYPEETYPEDVDYDSEAREVPPYEEVSDFE
ncbi:MAG: hypothetical protein WD025_03290 [Bacteriovoracaceae bacterium]